ncbi:MAG: hypothetical protein NUW24_10960 [Anaerolineae bacterium]|jgi:hypothetical protein|nr:hypothetical protein [Anaerolineae bacterium]MDH7475130.1 hypothetical protein [Anaerolineae bacterium]
MRWLIARYQPVGLFSLKPGEATSTGGKSLLVPTPFAIRTALLDVAIRVQGVVYGPQAFECIKALHLALRPSKRAAVTSLFTKVLKPERDAEEHGRAMQRTIAFREYVYLEGTLALALGGEPVYLDQVAPLLPHLTYLGKRGSFFQLLAPPETVETADTRPPDGFTAMVPWNQMDKACAGPITFPLGHVQRLDDWGADLTYEKINVYTSEKIQVGRDRIRIDTVLPYRLVRAGRGFTLYECE